MVVNPGGRQCRCGARGCWETEVGEDAVLLAAGLEPGSGARRHRRSPPPRQRATAWPQAALKRVGDWLGLGVGNLVNIFNPEVVVFGGALRQVFPLVRQQVQQALDQALTAPREQVRLVLPALGADSVIVGAAEVAFRPLLDDPLGISA